MSLIASILDRFLKNNARVGELVCPCGSVKCDLNVPASSFVLVDQTTALCHCVDCVGFCKACPNGDFLIDNYSTHLVNFYKSDVVVTKGQDKIKGVRLTKCTQIVRLYCQDCGTPLGAEVMRAPFVLLYAKLITKGPKYVPTLVLGRKWAPPEAEPYIGIPVKEYPLGFFFVVKLISRALLGLLFGKVGPAMLNDTDNYSSIPVGLASIPANKKTE